MTFKLIPFGARVHFSFAMVLKQVESTAETTLSADHLDPDNYDLSEGMRKLLEQAPTLLQNAINQTLMEHGASMDGGGGGEEVETLCCRMVNGEIVCEPC